MQIDLYCTTDLTYDQRMQRTARSLAAAGHQVTLVGRQLQKSLPLTHEPYKQVRLKCWFHSGWIFYFEYFIRMFWLAFWSTSEVLVGVDIDTLPGLALGRYLSWGFRYKRLIYDAHELFSEQEEVVSRPIIRRCWQWLEDRSIPQADMCYTVSHSLAAYFNDRYKRPFGVVRNMPDKISTASLDVSIESKLKEMQPYLLYVGAVNKNRGLEVILPLLQTHKINLVVCGDGPDLADLKERVCNLAIEKCVYFAGYVQPNKLKAYYSQAYAGLLLLQPTGLSYQFSLANKFFDYVLHGLPILATQLPEYEQLNQAYEVAVLCSQGEEESGLAKLLGQVGLYDQLKQQTIQAAKVWTWQNEEVRLLEMYHQLSLRSVL